MNSLMDLAARLAQGAIPAGTSLRAAERQYSAPCGSVGGVQSADPRSSKELRRQHIDIDGHSFRLCDEGPGDAVNHFTPDLAVAVLEQQPETVCLGCRAVLVRNYSAARHLVAVGTDPGWYTPNAATTSKPANALAMATHLNTMVDTLADFLADHPQKRILLEHLREIKQRTLAVLKELRLG